MNDYEISEIALQEIEEIVDDIAASDPDAADRLRDGIFKGCEQLARRPGLGHRGPDPTKLASLQDGSAPLPHRVSQRCATHRNRACFRTRP
jgi:plasmid stabilization system protein ParE